MQIVSSEYPLVNGGSKSGTKAQNVSPFSNEARNAYVVEHITAALLSRLKEKALSDISISELCDEAGVGRTSFYRNFVSREDILKKYIQKLMSEWKKSIDADGDTSGARMYGIILFLKAYQIPEQRKCQSQQDGHYLQYQHSLPPTSKSQPQPAVIQITNSTLSQKHLNH